VAGYVYQHGIRVKLAESLLLFSARVNKYHNTFKMANPLLLRLIR
jgi:hypothetical protein